MIIDKTRFILLSLITTILLGCSDDEERSYNLASTPQDSLSTDAVNKSSHDPAIRIYNRHCVACHRTGVGGAPKLGDDATWKLRLGQGIETVYYNTINGIRGMPPMGTCRSCSEDDIRSVVDYMIETDT